MIMDAGGSSSPCRLGMTVLAGFRSGCPWTVLMLTTITLLTRWEAETEEPGSSWASLHGVHTAAEAGREALPQQGGQEPILETCLHTCATVHTLNIHT